MKHCCRECHFMASDLNMGGTIPKTLTKEQRELLEPQSGSTWGCYKRDLEYFLSATRSQHRVLQRRGPLWSKC